MRSGVDAILMASGFSRRFGDTNKLLLDFAGQPLAGITLQLAMSLRAFDNVLLVAARPEVMRLADCLPAKVIINQNPGRGVCESIRLGVLSSSADSYLFFTCDQPFLDADTVQSILRADDGTHIISPAWGKQPGAPVLFPARFRDELLSLKDGESGRAIKKRHPEYLRNVEVTHPRVLWDIDCLEDYKRISRHIAQFYNNITSK